VSRPHKDKGSAGFYERGELHWYRFTFNGKRHSFSTETKIGKAGRVTVEAMQIAERKREEIEKGIVKAAEVTWEKATEKYISKKLHEDDFTVNTATTARYAFKSFYEFSKIENPQKVTQEIVKDFYYDLRARMAEATARNYATRVSIFLRDQGVEIEPVNFKGDVNHRTEIVDEGYIDELLGCCENNEVLFILYAGFLAGMRKNEIVMARPEWFHLGLNNNSYIKIPAKDNVTGFIPKSKRERKIPIVTEFEQFLEKWPEWREQKFMIAPNAKGKKYRYDFRKPLNDYLKSQEFKDPDGNAIGCFSFGPHVMRHSYISILAQKGTDLAVISAYSGDRIKTLETNYIHIRPSRRQVEEAFASSIH